MAKKITIIHDFKVRYEPRYKLAELSRITTSQEAEKILRETWNDGFFHFETFRLMLLNRCNKVLGIAEISQGGISGTVADIRIAAQAALLSNATSVLAAHNHPSGNVNPSEADKRLSERFKDGFELLDIRVMDFLILSPEDGYYSFADEGIL